MSLAMAAGGVVLVLLTLVDLFLTVFNYDGFTFLAGRYQRVLWRSLRLASRPLPAPTRHAVLSLGSAAMLPATVAAWLAAEVAGFALIYDRGLATHSFDVARNIALVVHLGSARVSRRPVGAGGLTRARRCA